jgi:hypothetical protein
MSDITRRAVLARTPAAIAAGAVSLPAIASASTDDDARLIALVDEMMKFNAQYNAATDLSAEEDDAMGERSSELYEEVMRTPASTERGALAKVLALIYEVAASDLTAAHFLRPFDADDDLLAHCYRRDGRYFQDWGAVSIFADLVRLSRAGGAS